MTNILKVPKWTKTYQRFHSTEKNDEVDLEKVVLGRDQKNEEDYDENLLSIMDGPKQQYIEQINEQEFTISKISEKIWDKYP